MDIPGQNCCWYTISFWEWWLECSLICFVFPTWNEGSRWESSIKQWCCFMLLSSRIQNQTLNHTFCYTNPASWSFLNGSPCWRQSCWRKHDRRAAPFRFDIKRSCKAEESHSQQVGRVSVSQKNIIYVYIFKYGGTINEDWKRQSQVALLDLCNGTFFALWTKAAPDDPKFEDLPERVMQVTTSCQITCHMKTAWNLKEERICTPPFCNQSGSKTSKKGLPHDLWLTQAASDPGVADSATQKGV